jgi:hypothetical protein
MTICDMIRMIFKCGLFVLIVSLSIKNDKILKTFAK